MAKAELPKEKLELFQYITRNLRTVLKNGLLYEPGHPVFDYSIKNLKLSLDKWLTAYGRIDLGFSENNLLLDGSYIQEKNDIFGEIAQYMHSRGLAALSIAKDVTEDELAKLFSSLKDDIKTIKEKGGVPGRIAPGAHIVIKQIDYSGLLTSAGGEGGEGDIWQSLSRITEEAREGKLPESKLEFLVEFLKDPSKSAAALNKIYRQAVEALKGDTAMEDIRKAIESIYEYFKNQEVEDEDVISQKIADIIKHLEPRLVLKLFEEAKAATREFDLASEITKNLSDEFMANLIASLMRDDSSVNKNLLKIFDRLLPDKERSGDVASIVADKLLEKELHSAEGISQLQITIKEIFSENPRSNFMSHMYKMTVDTFVSGKSEMSLTTRRILPLIEEYKRSFDVEQLKMEEVDLLLNILWLEQDPMEFRKFGLKLREMIPAILKLRDARRIREILEFITEKMRPEQQRNRDIDQEAEDILRQITSNETVVRVISFIPEADQKTIEDISYFIMNVKEKSTGQLLDAFIKEEDRPRRQRFGVVLSKIKEGAFSEISQRMEYCDSSAARDLFSILKTSDPQKVRAAAEGLLFHRSPDLRQEALDVYTPVTDEEKEKIFSIFRKDSNKAVREKAMAVLLKTKDAKTIEGLFRCVSKSPFGRDLLPRFIELCGQLKLQESLPYLRKIFLTSAFFNAGRFDAMRVASAVSLRQIGTDEAMDLIRKGRSDRRKAVSRMCSIIMELESQQPAQEGKE